MGAVEESRKAIQDFLAPELRTLAANMESLTKEQVRLRSDLAATEGRLSLAIDRNRDELIASEARVTAAIDRLRGDLPLLVRNAVLEQMLTEKQRVIENLQKTAH
jgi:hypothetical protein